jgi:hypothetical protein
LGQVMVESNCITERYSIDQGGGKRRGTERLS